ncbi:hypothetical protein DQW09_19345 [Ensifer adhaerens]|nr:hypothetical protein DQW09_19345 [Ensifer adhaerens]THA59836.1 hypothetical protein E5176_30790 [Ensifer adhaerens]
MAGPIGRMVVISSFVAALTRFWGRVKTLPRAGTPPPCPRSIAALDESHKPKASLPVMTLF